MSGTLTFYFVDSEGGQSTVVHLPSGEILVIDTGNAGMRDGERMLAVLQDELGASEIDYLLTTHYDSDHVGGVPYLAARMGINQYFDHGNPGAPQQYLALANASARLSIRTLQQSATIPFEVLVTPPQLSFADQQQLSNALIAIGNGTRAGALKPLLNQDQVIVASDDDLGALRSFLSGAGIDLAQAGN